MHIKTPLGVIGNILVEYLMWFVISFVLFWTALGTFTRLGFLDSSFNATYDISFALSFIGAIIFMVIDHRR